MAIDIINVNGRHTKQLAIDAFNKVNGTQANPDFKYLEFEKTSVDGAVILHNPGTQRGVVTSKIQLADIFPKTINLRPFKEHSGNLPEYTADAVPLINNRHNTDLVHTAKDVFKGQTSASKENARLFLLFCRVFGFYELDISEVDLFNGDDTLYIAVNPNNKVYTGLIEVLV